MNFKKTFIVKNREMCKLAQDLYFMIPHILYFICNSIFNDDSLFTETAFVCVVNWLYS